MPAPPFFHSPGDIASWVTNRSCSRPGPESPESSAASSTLAESRSRPLAWSSVSACINAFGVSPAQRRNRWWSSSGVTAADELHHLFRDEGDRAPHRIIVAQRGVLGAGLGQALVMYG